MQRTKKTRAERRAKADAFRKAVEGMTGSGIVTTFFCAKDDDRAMAELSRPENGRHAEMIAKALLMVGPHSETDCLLCGYTLKKPADLSCIMSFLPGDGSNRGMAMGACCGCRDKYDSYEKLRSDMFAYVKENLWPDLRTLNDANFSTQAGRA